MSAQPNTVFLVDDDDAVRDSVSLLMRSAGLHTREFDSARAFLEGYDQDQPGCLLLDVRMPGMSGLELQKELNKRNHTLPIVFISAHGDIPMAVEAVRHGAVDFIQKPFDDLELLSKVKQALASSEQRFAEETERLEICRRTASLTAREREVMSQVVKGKANKVIASDLGVSQRTVEIHRARVMEKMQAASLAQLVRMVLISEASI
ncbi:MAG: response regulator transcription factor [Gammaproteobacteria bacterium]